MNAEELLARTGERSTPWQRALARAAALVEQFRREQEIAARGEDHQAVWRELMFLYGRVDSVYPPEDER